MLRNWRDTRHQRDGEYPQGLVRVGGSHPPPCQEGVSRQSSEKEKEEKEE